MTRSASPPDQPSPATLGRIIREAREQKGLSVRQLAKQVGKDFGYLARLESDFYKRPSLKVLQRIAELLGTDFAEMVRLTGQPMPENLPGLPRYIRDRYAVDDETASRIAEQWQQILDDHDVTEPPNKPRSAPS